MVVCVVCVVVCNVTKNEPFFSVGNKSNTQNETKQNSLKETHARDEPFGFFDADVGAGCRSTY